METRELEAMATSYLLDGCRERPFDTKKILTLTTSVRSSDFRGVQKPKHAPGFSPWVFDIEKARKDFAIAYGFQRHLGNFEMMELCTRLLASTGIDNEEVMRLREIGYETVSIGITAADAVAEILKAKPEGR